MSKSLQICYFPYLFLNKEKAIDFFSKKVGIWDDRLILSDIKKLIKYPKTHNDLVLWIKFTYHESFREDFKILADEIIKINKNNLEPWAIDFLTNLGFWGVKKPSTWKSYVTFENS